MALIRWRSNRAYSDFSGMKWPCRSIATLWFDLHMYRTSKDPDKIPSTALSYDVGHVSCPETLDFTRNMHIPLLSTPCLLWGSFSSRKRVRILQATYEWSCGCFAESVGEKFLSSKILCLSLLWSERNSVSCSSSFGHVLIRWLCDPHLWHVRSTRLAYGQFFILCPFMLQL